VSLTSSKVAELLRSGAPCKVPAGQSLYLIVRRPGVAYYIGQFRDRANGGRFQTKGLGRAPTTSLAAARKAWEDDRSARRHSVARAVNGALPTAAAIAPAAVSALAGKPFAKALEAYLEIKAPHWRGGLQGREAIQWRSMPGNSLLAPLTLAQLDQATVKAYLDTLAHAPRQQRNVGKRVAAVLDYMRSGEIKTKGPKVVNHPAMPAKELPAFYDLLSAVNEPQARALQFAILTAARIGEVTGGVTGKPPATWAEVDGDVWTVPGERMKNGVEHRVPLTPQMLAILGERGAPEAPLFDISYSAVYKLVKRYAPTVTVHGFRSTFKQWADDTSIDDGLSEAALAHVRGDATHRAYARGDLFQRRRDVMASWSAFCESH
jgi:integrase